MRGPITKPTVLTLIKAISLIPFILSLPTHAYGYTDPGTGAFLYQAIYAAFLGASFYFRRFLNRFGGKREK